jgi:carboxyl-terminal processing protease
MRHPQQTRGGPTLLMVEVRSSRCSLLVGLALGVAATLGVQSFGARMLGVREADAGKPKQGPLEREQFHDTLDVVLDRYVETLDAPEVMARGLKHMVGGLDPYSHYLTAAERTQAQKLQAQGAEAGLVTRFELDPAGVHEPSLEILAVHPGSPAAKLGLGAGDRILAIRARPSARMLSNVEAQLLLGGAPGERVAVQVERGAGVEELTLELAKPDTDALVESALIPSSDGPLLASVAIHAFRPGTAELVKRALAELRRSAGSRPLAGLILDLRGNPGGEVSEAVLVADLFIGEGVLTRTRGRGGVILREELASAAGTDASLPLVVLQDRRSASAAELLAVALQDHHRATVVGERSFGKGTVQELITIPDGSILTLTVARYFSPRDRLIDGHGVEPDVVLEHSSEPAAVSAAAQELSAQIARSRAP